MAWQMFDACLGDANVGVRVAALKAACSFFQDVYTADAGGRFFVSVVLFCLW